MRNADVRKGCLPLLRLKLTLKGNGPTGVIKVLDLVQHLVPATLI
jgi:hypothetical protein